MHLLEGLGRVIPGDTLRLDIIEEVLDKMHLREVPTCTPIFLSYTGILAKAVSSEGIIDLRARAL